MTKQNVLHNTGDVNNLITTFLQDPEKAEIYLKVALEEYQEDDDIEAFLLALKNVAIAQGGMGRLAQLTHLNRQNLYQTLSGRGNPRLITLSKVLKALGFHLSLNSIKKQKSG